MKLYRVSDRYISYLKGLDTKVPDNYNGKRPYVGVLIFVDDVKYLAPLTSPKEKHERMKDNDVTLFKLYDAGEAGRGLGIINLNNMIPVIEEEITLLDLDAQSVDYKSLLQKQIEYIRKNKELIQLRAKKLRQLVINNRHTKAVAISCNFQLLEENYKSFNQN
ncbi:type III toxin-antitoxin system ToxN/AbiQ family toxin [Pectobacterium parvum]|uniref:type III toxin-antitoxin system ToxN/AbiQ family toxin n=1 Tax=Pectobacterium parvum TaxID=2778550 RepID=UPI0038099619